MDTIEAIHGRRSIRKYSDQPVSEQLVHQILSAAMAAPSASNQQPWQFVIIDDRSILDRIPKLNPAAGALRQAPLAIVVCGDLRQEKAKGFWVQDCSAAIQNLLVAAYAKGLGTVWMGLYPLEIRVTEMCELLKLPKEVIPLAVIAVGYPAEQKQPVDRFDASRIHRNRW
jgi:nitroreductase